MTRTPLILIALLVAVLPPAAWSEPAAPMKQIQAYVDRVVRVLEDPALQGEAKRLQRQRAVRDAALEMIDARAAAQRALGIHWRNRTPQEREQFTALFVDLLERSYSQKIDLYAGERVRLTGESIDGEYAVVRGLVIRKTGPEVAAEVRLIRRGDRWLIYDVVVENLSLVANYRSQFDRVIRTSSYEALVQKLEANRAAAAEK